MKTVQRKRNIFSQHISHPVSIFVISAGFSLLVLYFFVLPFFNILNSIPQEKDSFAASSRSNSTIPIYNLEAEEMSTYSLTGGLQIVDDQDASGGHALQFSLNTTSEGIITLPSDAKLLTVRARGARCKGNPKIKIAVSGREVYTKGITSDTWNEYTTNITLPSGTHNISVSFINDYSGASCERDLFVDSLMFR